jgi:NADP-dependent 3-hydroxy acid dehydrogenase YdfG
MTAIAIVGAGAGLGLSVARVFGGHGFDIALIARDADRLDEHATALEAEGVRAAGFAADAADQTALAAAMELAADRFGGIDVLEFSVPPAGLVTDLDVTVENLRPQVECICYGAVTATRAVLPAMLAAGTGTLLFTTGASSVTPVPRFGGPGIAGAALRNWAMNLNATLADNGIYVGHVAIGAWISGTPGPADAPRLDPDDLARIYWDLHTARDRAECLVTA